MVSVTIPDDLVRRATADLCARFSLDADQVRALAALIAAGPDGSRSAENLAFAADFMKRHHETFERLSR